MMIIYSIAVNQYEDIGPITDMIHHYLQTKNLHLNLTIILVELTTNLFLFKSENYEITF